MSANVRFVANLVQMTDVSVRLEAAYAWADGGVDKKGIVWAC